MLILSLVIHDNGMFPPPIFIFETIPDVSFLAFYYIPVISQTQHEHHFFFLCFLFFPVTLKKMITEIAVPLGCILLY